MANVSPTSPPPPAPLAAPGARAAWPLRWHLALVLAVGVVSWLLAQAAVSYAEEHVLRGGGYLAEYVSWPLFRFDAVHYRDLAEHGYRYNGDPYRTPNLVVAPAFPLLIRLVVALPPLDAVSAGFALVHVQFLLGLALIFLVLRQWYGTGAAWFAVVGLCFSAGSFAFHAYYSESTMLCWLALACLAWQRQRFWLAAAAAGVLGASRVTAAPPARLQSRRGAVIHYPP